MTWAWSICHVDSLISFHYFGCFVNSKTSDPEPRKSSHNILAKRLWIVYTYDDCCYAYESINQIHFFGCSSGVVLLWLDNNPWTLLCRCKLDRTECSVDHQNGGSANQCVHCSASLFFWYVQTELNRSTSIKRSGDTSISNNGSEPFCPAHSLQSWPECLQRMVFTGGSVDI